MRNTDLPTSCDEPADESLIRRFQTGDTAAFETFVRRHQDRVHRIAGGMLLAPSRAADVTQDVFLRAFTGLRRFRFGAKPFTWLYRTTRNVCHEYNRREPVREVSENDLGAGTADEANARVGRGVAPSPEHVTGVTRTFERVRAEIADLPARQRDVVLLRVFEEMSVDETARAMGCRPGTVKALLHKALGRIRSRHESVDQ